MNLLINNTCNRACPYCFARAKVGQARPEGRQISLEDFELYLDFVVRNGMRRIKLLGGEPALHPEFLEILRRASQRGLDTLVFTNGLWPASIREGLRAIPLAEWKVRFVFNVHEPRLQPAAELALAFESIKIAGGQGACGFTIYREGFDLQFIPDLIDAAGMSRDLRLGLAAPVAGAENLFVEAARFRAIGSRLVEQLERLERRDVLASFDCGFPLCMFPNENLGKLIRSSRKFHSVCGFPVDVGPDLTAWPCFPLSNIANVRLLDFPNAAELRAFYSSRLAHLRRIGALEACAACKYRRREQCCGGCAARALRALVARDGEVRNVTGTAARLASV